MTIVTLLVSMGNVMFRFKDVVECDRIVVRAAEGPYEVTTTFFFRAFNDFFSFEGGDVSFRGSVERLSDDFECVSRARDVGRRKGRG